MAKKKGSFAPFVTRIPHLANMAMWGSATRMYASFTGIILRSMQITESNEIALLGFDGVRYTLL
jgi:hypothetical protein